jgi:hypothetical protein
MRLVWDWFLVRWSNTSLGRILRPYGLLADVGRNRHSRILSRFSYIPRVAGRLHGGI